MVSGFGSDALDNEGRRENGVVKASDCDRRDNEGSSLSDAERLDADDEDVDRRRTNEGAALDDALEFVATDDLFVSAHVPVVEPDSTVLLLPTCRTEMVYQIDVTRKKTEISIKQQKAIELEKGSP